MTKFSQHVERWWNLNFQFPAEIQDLSCKLQAPLAPLGQALYHEQHRPLERQSLSGIFYFWQSAPKILQFCWIFRCNSIVLVFSSLFNDRISWIFWNLVPPGNFLDLQRKWFREAPFWKVVCSNGHWSFGGVGGQIQIGNFLYLVNIFLSLIFLM